MLFVLHTTWSGEKICYSISRAVKLSTQSFDRNLCHSTLISGLSYKLPNLSRQAQDTANLCPFPTLRIFLHHRIWWRSCSTASTFAVLRIEERRTRQWLALFLQFVVWRVQLHTRKMFLWSSFLNSLLLEAACVFCLWGTSLPWFFHSDYVLTLDNDTFAIINTQTSNMRGEHWILSPNSCQILYFADFVGCQKYSFFKQQYEQMMPEPLHSHPSVCGFYTMYGAFHLLKFQQEEIKGVHDFNVRSVISNYM